MGATPTPHDELLCRLVRHRRWLSDSQLEAVCEHWSASPDRPLAEVLAIHGGLTADQCAELQELAAPGVDAVNHQPAGAESQTLPPAIRRFFPRQPSDVVLASEASVGAPRLPPKRLPAGSVPLPRHTSPERFQIQHVHAQGGLGVVYIARDEEIDRSVAVKQIKERWVADESAQTRFLLEARITGRLEHPGIVPIYSLGADSTGRPFYAMRLIRGESLLDVIERFHGPARDGTRPDERLSELRKLLRRFVDACNAIDYAHSKGVLHRDVKPSNIMVGKYGETLVVDWGLAKVIGAEEDLALTTRMVRSPDREGDATATRAGATIGTPAYMSPEQAAGRNDELGPATDVYSLGATLYQLLTGELPLAGDEDPAVVTAQAAHGAITPPHWRAPWLPRPMSSICMKALATSPDDRYPSARALADDVERWLGNEPADAHAERWRERCFRWLRNHRSLAAMLIAAYVVATTAALVVLLARTTTP